MAYNGPALEWAWLYLRYKRIGLLPYRGTFEEQPWFVGSLFELLAWEDHERDESERARWLTSRTPSEAKPT